MHMHMHDLAGEEELPIAKIQEVSRDVERMTLKIELACSACQMIPFPFQLTRSGSFGAVKGLWMASLCKCGQ